MRTGATATTTPTMMTAEARDARDAQALAQALLPRAVDVAAVTFGPARQRDTGQRAVALLLHGRALTVQTPELEAPFGLRKWGGNGEREKGTLELAVAAAPHDATAVAFHDMLAALDALVVAQAFDKSAAWFKKRHDSREAVAALYTPMLRPASSDRYPPSLRLNLPIREGRYECEAVPADLDAVNTVRARVSAVMQCTGVWIAGGRFGCAWRALSVRVTPAAPRLSGYAFVPVADEEEEGGGDAGAA